MSRNITGNSHCTSRSDSAQSVFAWFLIDNHPAVKGVIDFSQSLQATQPSPPSTEQSNQREQGNMAGPRVFLHEIAPKLHSELSLPK